MCAKKATSPAPRKSAAPATSKAPVASKAPVTGKAPTASKAAANGKAVAAAASPAKPKERTLSQHDIGSVAGEIWGLLAKGDGLTIAALKKAVAAPPDVVVAAMGWLAREEKLEFATSGRTLKVALKT